MNVGDVTVKKFGKKNDFLVKIEMKKSSDVDFINSIKEKLSKSLGSSVNFRRVENVGPKVSGELLSDGLLSISLALAAMLFYIWIRFEWQFSLGAIIAILHDVLITVGIFSFLSYEINLSIVAAVLTIVGYSMNDTVVIFDRIRENLKKYSKVHISEISNTSTNETLSRNFNYICYYIISFVINLYFWRRNIKGVFFRHDCWSNCWYLFFYFCCNASFKLYKRKP